MQEFKKNLSNIGIPYKICDKYFSYHFGYMIDKNSKRNFSKLLSEDEYFHEHINKTKIIVNMVDNLLSEEEILILTLMHLYVEQ